ncbi:Invasion gene expression up-regulator SirB [Ferriphaselus amnicola]|uniref:Invasion gene expression up-regulator SirB n=1 Tax=Ferriphaselus amnicola TaxID=1188319 RepID=A0A2Z6GE23_9PROT|nr:SirB2 family protein [Ferriphaselus amnicola]BBE51680.1 Invasion gene expression up-regulator SirB [Ferriphaselus amnicola]
MLLLKYIHLSCVALSFSLFWLRGFWLLRNSSIMRQRWVRVIPHSVDSLLLASAIWLAWQLGYSPANSPWLAAKIIALMVYIGLGILAFRIIQTHSARLMTWLAAQLVFFYIAATAITHDPFLTY